MSLAVVEGMDVSAYGIARGLGRAGVPVVAVNHDASEPLRFSRYCRGFYLYPSDPSQPRTFAGDCVPDEAVLTELLLGWANELPARPVLFATSDWFARLLANQRHRLEARFRHHWIGSDLFATINDKGRMAAACAALGVAVPETHVLGERLPQLRYPVLVKPLHRYTTRFPVAGKAWVAASASELERFVETHPELKGATILQEQIRGGDDQIWQCVLLVNSSGELGGAVTVQKLRQCPPGLGSMCHGRTEPNPAVQEAALRIVRALGYRGLAGVELKYCDGRYWFIEMNTRLPWYNGLLADAGVNLAHRAFADLAGGEIDSGRQRDRVTWCAARESWRSHRRERAAKGLSGWLASVTRSGSFAWWNARDPAPFVAASLPVGRLFARLRRGPRPLTSSASGGAADPRRRTA